MRTIVVSGALANKYRNGGEAWVRLSWALGFQRLGFAVYFIEQIARASCVDASGNPSAFADSVNLQYFRSVTEAFGLKDRAVLVCDDGTESSGVAWERLLDVCESAELLVNISGHLTLAPLLRKIRRKAYIDIDPGFTQFWNVDPSMAFEVKGHEFYFTIGRNIGLPGCPIPTGNIHWRHVHQPVVLDQWPVSPGVRADRFTTVASWRGAFGPVQAGGRTYGVKVHEFRKVLALPGLVAERVGRSGADAPTFEIALDIHPADAKDLAALHANGWVVADPRAAAGTPEAFRRYVQESGAEFSVAQGIYTETISGWFSDRTIRYLASGKPALVQETGFSAHMKTGMGLVPFSTLEEATAGAAHIVQHYDDHSAAARAVAAENFDSDKVLARFLDEVGVRPN